MIPAGQGIFYAGLIDLPLQDKRSPATRPAYAGDLTYFFREPTPSALEEFLPVPELSRRLIVYQDSLHASVGHGHHQAPHLRCPLPAENGAPIGVIPERRP